MRPGQTQPFIERELKMAITISSSRADSASVPGVTFKWASALIGWRHLNRFESGPVHWLVDNNYHMK